MFPSYKVCTHLLLHSAACWRIGQQRSVKIEVIPLPLLNSYVPAGFQQAPYPFSLPLLKVVFHCNAIETILVVRERA